MNSPENLSLKQEKWKEAMFYYNSNWFSFNKTPQSLINTYLIF